MTNHASPNATGFDQSPFRSRTIVTRSAATNASPIATRPSDGPLTSAQSLSALRPAGTTNIERYRRATKGWDHRYRAASLAPVVAVGGVMRASHHARTIATASDGATA